MNSGKPQPISAPQPSGLRPLRLAFLAAAVVLGLLPYLAWQWLDLEPKLVPPSVHLPSPNAFDDFKAAANLISPPDADRLVALTLRPRPGARARFRPSPAEQAAFIQRNEKALRRFRQGRSHRYREPLQTTEAPSFDSYQGLQNLSDLLRLQGWVRGQRGDWAGRLAGCLDALHLGVEVPHGSGVMGSFVGSMIQANARRDAWEHLPQIPRGAARDASRRLERICTRQTPLWETLEMEKWYRQTDLRETMRGRGWRRQLLLDMTGIGSPAQPWPQSPDEWALFAAMHTTSKSAALYNLAHHYDQAIAAARGPEGLTAPLPPAPADAVNRLISGISLEQVRFRVAVNQALNELLLLTVALRAYHDDHRCHPAALAELVPRYLRALPTDPFAAGFPYRYARTPAGYRLYSMGPDLQDNGGRSILAAPGAGAKVPPRHALLEPGAPGDLLAGTNL